ncbi:MAG: hypoxanthine phosphoribosyltransferase [Synergistaceae bacterium]|nr:hypoxanthine phosphoribosyltransferase [Synergistaceae bacterium]
MGEGKCDLRLGKILLDRGEIARRVSEIADEITRTYSGQEIIVTGVLKGAVIFMTDLVRQIGSEVDVRMDFMAVSSYGNSSTSSGVVKIVKDMDASIEGKNVLIVEDIMDTGLTLSYLSGIMTAREPKSVRTCVLLEKPERKRVESKIAYRGFVIPDEFVVGYGLDYAGRWRNLPDIWRVEEERNGPRV